ncbi:hypothetical protein BT63DRAFT_480856 [Microthyrium microscopicum]|uniref:Uncharacterized protein n=1 Tax=Microthyrium microscopicum TaxID=703497 RepID=A0A6A6U6U3_9PEZI|nr:hypothetical protein BT63DRAFT_480856 [Microthyrium microscopicum]
MVRSQQHSCFWAIFWIVIPCSRIPKHGKPADPKGGHCDSHSLHGVEGFTGKYRSLYNQYDNNNGCCFPTPLSVLFRLFSEGVLSARAPSSQSTPQCTGTLHCWTRRKSTAYQRGRKCPAFRSIKEPPSPPRDSDAAIEPSIRLTSTRLARFDFRLPERSAPLDRFYVRRLDIGVIGHNFQMLVQQLDIPATFKPPRRHSYPLPTESRISKSLRLSRRPRNTSRGFNPTLHYGVLSSMGAVATDDFCKIPTLSDKSSLMQRQVLFGLLIITISLGLLKNWYAWHKNRKYIKLQGPIGASTFPKRIDIDIEARVMAEIDEIPFGIRALQRGIEVEGVWISQTNTPMPGSPVTSAFPSPPASLFGSPSGRLPPPEIPGSEFAIPRLSLGRPEQTPRIPSFTLESLATSFGVSMEQLYEYQRSESDSSGIYMSTLDALEGRVRSPGKSSIDDQYRRDRKSRSDMSSHYGESSTNRDGSPSPPALTDGASRADTPLSSSDMRPALSAYLSESNHRLSHVAETGQLTPRVRMPRAGDSITVPSMNPAHYSASTFNFAHHPPPKVRSPTRGTFNTLAPPGFTSFSESHLPTLHAPKPVLAANRPQFDLRTFSADGMSSDWGHTPHIRTPSGNLLITGHHPSPMLAEYMSQSMSEANHPVVRKFSNGSQSVNNDDDISLAPTTKSAPEVSSRYPDPRKARSHLEGQGRSRETTVSWTSPVELPPLPAVDTALEVKIKKGEKKSSKKLQKKKRSKSSGAII